MIIQPVHDVDLERRYCSDCKNNTLLDILYVMPMTSCACGLERPIFCDAYYVFFCHIDLLRFDLSFM